MKVAGAMIKQARKKLNMTQIDLARGICKQPTISHIENKNAVESFNVIFAICERLKLDVNQVINDSDGLDIEDYLNQIDSLCTHNKHQKALMLLEQKVPLEKVKDHQKSRAYYYYGLTQFISKKNYDKALYYFHKIVELNNDMKYLTLAKNSIAVIYELKGDNVAAKDYYEAALELLSDASFAKDTEMIKVFHSSAKFFCKIGDYQRAYDLSEDGVLLAKETNNTYLVDYILCEKAYNARALGLDDSEELFCKAMVFAEFNDNQELIETIEAELAESAIPQ